MEDPEAPVVVMVAAPLVDMTAEVVTVPFMDARLDLDDEDMLPVADAEVMVMEAEPDEDEAADMEPVMVAVALQDLQRAVPTLAATSRSLPEVQAAIRQGAALEAMAFMDEPHWQAMSVGAQPAAEMAEVRQDVCCG